MGGDWQTLKLGDLGKVVTGKTPSKNEKNAYGKDIPFVTPRDMDGCRIIKSTERSLSVRGAQTVRNSIVPPNSVAVSCIGSDMGKAAIIPHKSVTNQQINTIIIDDHFDYKYVYYDLSRRKEEIRSAAGGSAQPILNKSHFSDLPITLPPLPEQKAIAHILGSLDDKIELNRKMNETLEGMAQALFKSWFVDFDPVIDNALAAGNPIPDELADRAEVRRQALADGTANREAAKPFPDSFQETDELSWIPKGWQVRPIEDCIKRFPAGKKYETKTAEETGAVPILDQGKSGFIGFHNDEPGVKASPDDPIIVFANHTCYMRLIMFDFSAIQNVLPFKGEGLNIFWLFEATKGRQQFNEYKGHWPDFVIKKLVVPTLPLVSIFGEIIELNHQKIYANELKNQSLTKLRDTLLPKLISGELRMPEVKQLTNETLT
jgi:type I restriction enzyme S subunit